MLKKIVFIVLWISVVSCDTRSVEEKIDNLNGYWTISKVETNEGKTKEYSFSSTVDYFEITNNKGFRKKVQPKLDGTYVVTDDVENIVVKVENDSINLYYSTEMDQWKETLIASEANKITFLNEYGNKYTYERFTGYLNETHGEKEQ
ncbi:MAG TPA: lipocalin family protein [Flavobacteriaceae bacterium]|nr:lipocalin family protein [Flavobacteriaceae bacterium]